MGHLEHADDLVLMLTSRAALQAKIIAVQRWCVTNAMQLNATKSAYLVFGGKSSADTAGVEVARQPVPPSAEYTYVGVSLNSGRYLIGNHMQKQTTKTRGLARLILKTVRRMTGDAPPSQLRTLYLARLDPHIIYGAEVAPLAQKNTIDALELVQRKYARAMLGLNPRSLTAFLHVETNILSARYRRVLHTPRYLV